MLESLTVLGSGSIIPRENRGCAGYVVRAGGEPLLLDCGPGSLLRLHQAGISLPALRLILISHFHLDHVGDLLPVLHSRWLQSGRRKAPALVIGPRGLKRWLRRASSAAGWVRELGLELVEAGKGALTVAGLKMTACPTGHTRESIGFRFSDGGGRVLFYSGDVDDYRRVVAPAADADLALVECSWTSAPAWEGHLTPESAGRLAAEGKVRRLLLTHFYQPVRRTAILEAVAAVFSGPVELAEDLADYAITPQ